MARLQLFAAPRGEGYLLDVQAGLFDDFGTRVVVPLLPKDTTPPLITATGTALTLGCNPTAAEIEAALARPREATLLHLTLPAPVLVIERRTFTDQGLLIEYVHSVYRGDRYKFHSTLAPQQG